jgi:hypothetical protein
LRQLPGPERTRLEKKPYVDQPKSLEDYVKSEYIGTMGCFSSSMLCDIQLNRCKRLKARAICLKPFYNIGEETITRETGEL